MDAAEGGPHSSNGPLTGSDFGNAPLDLERHGRPDRCADQGALGDGAVTLTTMRFADEIRPAGDVDAATQKSHKATRGQLDIAVAVIEELSGDWDPDKHKDR